MIQLLPLKLQLKTQNLICLLRQGWVEEGVVDRNVLKSPHSILSLSDSLLLASHPSVGNSHFVLHVIFHPHASYTFSLGFHFSFFLCSRLFVLDLSFFLPILCLPFNSVPHPFLPECLPLFFFCSFSFLSLVPEHNWCSRLRISWLIIQRSQVLDRRGGGGGVNNVSYRETPPIIHLKKNLTEIRTV